MQDVGILQLVDNHFVFPKRDVTKPFPNDHTVNEKTVEGTSMCVRPQAQE